MADAIPIFGQYALAADVLGGKPLGVISYVLAVCRSWRARCCWWRFLAPSEAGDDYFWTVAGVVAADSGTGGANFSFRLTCGQYWRIRFPPNFHPSSQA
jgi:hypothetical protein